MNTLTWADSYPLALLYFMFVGTFYGVILLVTPIVAVVVSPRTWPAFGSRMARTALFLVILLLVGNATSLVWSYTVWGRLYYSTDYCGFDLLPFLPITQGLIDEPFGDERGRLIGVSLFQLNLVWLVFAFFIWMATIWLYRKQLRTFGPS